MNTHDEIAHRQNPIYLKPLPVFSTGQAEQLLWGSETTNQNNAT